MSRVLPSMGSAALFPRAKWIYPFKSDVHVPTLKCSNRRPEANIGTRQSKRNTNRRMNFSGGVPTTVLLALRYRLSASKTATGAGCPSAVYYQGRLNNTTLRPARSKSIFGNPHSCRALSAVVSSHQPPSLPCHRNTGTVRCLQTD